ncbi:HYC_CC_PP family protein [Chitinophaga ginsengisoli]|uniref:Uncharacterized protein n=1 Tax=Chitinophaga ginsengisoli TaxID=363837 RepID=A0A2P8GCQ9_9BACT|nr:hypothetical protein [Chitinophaga ginsengisoli]PSL31764.1 hypothetical protein CLV42_10458 [Chitinophaga ginsengisoli]
MKRFITILLAFLYVTLTSGFTVNAHYCMGKLAAVDFKSHADDICNMCSKSGKKGKCCKDEYKYCKADVSFHEVGKVQQNSEPSVKALSLPVIIVPVSALTISHRIVINNHGPPDCECIPLYIQYCTYLI